MRRWCSVRCPCRAWAPTPAGPRAREAGAKVGVYDPVPGWQPAWIDPQNPTVVYQPFRIDNEMDPNRQKHIELLVDFSDRDSNYINEDIRLRYVNALGLEVIASPTSRLISGDNGQVLFRWELDMQPAWEELLFPSYLDYGVLEGRVASWDVAMDCVPEPGLMPLAAACGLWMLGRRRRTA